MRIRKLGLRRYGKFTDGVIDFGERSAGAPDLHIVYGPNEAGKSTAMSACMDLFYGIHHQSRFNFLHPYPTMRIEAELETFGTVRSFSRIKLPHNSLLDDAGNTVADAMLLGELGGLDRNAYQTMFCLDDETLEAGGESILASKGDLGHLLFSATAGLADLSDRLGSAKAEAESFFRSGKRSGALADLKKELANLKDERDRTDTLASEYSRLVIERDEATSAYAEAIAQRGRTQARIDEVQRFINALPGLQTFRSLRAELLPLATLPDAPSTWADDLPALMTRQTKLATQAQTVAETIADLRDELERLVFNASACGLEDRIELLTDLRARHVTAEKDLPDRRLRLGLAEQTVARVLTRIDHGSEQDPARLVLSTAVTGPIRDLMERRSGVEAALAAAEAEVDKAVEALSLAETKIEELRREIRRSGDRRLDRGHRDRSSDRRRRAIACGRSLMPRARGRIQRPPDRAASLDGRQEYALCGIGTDARPTSALGFDRSGPCSRNRFAARRTGSPRRRGRTPRCENRGAWFRGWRRQRQGRWRSPVRSRSRLGRSQGGAGCKDGRRVRDRHAETRSDHGAASQSYCGRR